MRVVNMSQEELQELIKSGKAKQIHLSAVKDVLIPRGSMKKNSLGLVIFERLMTNYEYWTDKKYSDNPEKSVLIDTLFNNLMNEAFSAWETFLKKVGTT